MGDSEVEAAVPTDARVRPVAGPGRELRAIGVDTVVERSGVSKTSLYRLFESKDALIAAFAAEQDRLFWARWDQIEEQHADDPRALLEALLSGIDGISFCTLTEVDVVRHPLVQKIIVAYEARDRGRLRAASPPET